MSRWNRLAVLSAPLLLIGGAAIGAAASPAPDPRLGAAAGAVREYVDALGRLPDLPGLAQQVPMTALDAASARGLDLRNAFQQAASALPTAYTDPADLAAELEAVQGTTPGGVAYRLGCPGTSCGSGEGVTALVSEDRLDLTVPLHLSRTVDAPLSFSAPPVAVSDGTVRTALEFSVPLRFTIDLATVQTAPTTALTTQAPYVGTLSATFDDSAVSVNTSFGFTQLTVGGSITSGGLSMPVRFEDPDGLGGLTLDEFASTAINDLASATLTSSLSASITLDTPITTASPDVSVSFAPTSTTGTAVTPTVTAGSLGILGRFDNISPSEVLGGVGQLATAVASLTSGGDAALPFLREGLAALAGLAQPVIDFVTSQSVVCGTQDTNPPSGPIDPAAVGLAFFCQATAAGAVKAGSISWTPTNAVAATDADHDNGTGTVAPATAGPGDRKRARFTTTGAGPVGMTAAYTLLEEGGGEQLRHVSMPPTTAQELRTRLATVAGFDPTGAIAYDDSKRALTFRLTRTVDLPAPGGSQSNATFDFGDKLKQATGLFGVSPTGTASVRVGMTGVKLDLTFGVLLVDSPDDVDPAGTAYGPYAPETPRGPHDRFFIAPPPSGPVISIGNATVAADVALRGRLGFVDVDLSGIDGSAFSITKPTGSAPMLAVGFAPPGSGVPVRVDGTTQTVPGAVTLRGLGKLNLLDGSTVTKTINARLQAGLHGAARIANGTPGGILLGEGDISITVPQASALFADPVPSDAVQISAGEFNTALGSLDDIDATNPQAMLSLILSGLSTLLDGVSGAGGFFDTALPVLGSSPRQLFTQLESVRRTVAELNGAPGPRINCGREVRSGAISGNPDGVGPLGNVFCEAVLPKPLAAGTTPVWSITGGSVMSGGTDATTVGVTDPAGAVTFRATSGFLVSADHPDGYRVALRYTDVDGEHVVEFPALSVPSSLQSLVDALTAKLGLRPGSLTAAKQAVQHGTESVDALVFKVASGVCTLDRVSHATAGERCVDADFRPATAPSVPVNLDLGSVGGLAGVTGQGSLPLSLLARANLGIAIPLRSGSAPLILGDSGLVLRAGVDTSTTPLSFNARIGPLQFAAGSGVDTSSTEDGVQPGAGLVKVGTGVDVGRSGGSASQAFTPSEFVSTSGAGFGVRQGSTSSQDCGEGKNGTTTVALTGLACARFAVAFNGSYLGDVGLAVESLTGPFKPAVPKSVIDKLGAELLSLQFVLDTLSRIVGQVRDELAGAGAEVKLPVVGNALDAGASVADKLQAVVDEISEVASQTIGNDTSPSAFATQVRNLLHAELSKTNLLQDRNGVGGVTAEDVSVVPSCTSSPCPTGAGSGLTLHDLHITFALGQGTIAPDGKSCTGPGCATDAVIPFDVGLDGLPVRASGALAPSAGWKMLVDFGINRNTGPYLVANHADPEIVVGASVGLDTSPGGCLTEIDTATTGNATLDGYSSDRCLQGTLGFLGVNLRDRVATPSKIGVHAEMRLRKKGTSGANARLSFNDILGGQADPQLTASAASDIHLRLRTGVKAGETVSLPSVVGLLHITGSISVSTTGGASVTPPSVTFDNLYIDLGRSLGEFLGGVVNDVKRVTSPFKPVVDTMQAPLPVLTQLAALVGKPPVTLVGLLEAVSGADLSLLRSFLSLLQFVQALPPPSGGTVLIGLGAGSGSDRAGGQFTVDAAAAMKPTTPDKVADTLAPPGSRTVGGDLLSEIGAMHGGNASTNTNPMNPSRAPYVTGSTEAARPSTFGVRGLSFPLFQQPSNVISVLLGQDVKIVEYDVGTLRATAGFDVTFGPFLIGPVPVSVFVGASVTLQGRFVFGYDTSGLRRVLSGASGEHLLDGLYLSDLLNGADVPEITLTGAVHAGAQVDLVVVKAGVEGGIALTLDLNLHDDDNDGVLHIDEIANKLSNPICLFDVRGALDFFLNFFLQFNFLFYQDRFTFEILRVRLLDFSASCASTRPPELAHFDSAHAGRLVLNMGPQALRDRRGLQAGTTDEKFTVRRVAADGTYAVTAFGLTQEYGPSAPTPGPAVTAVYANGDAGQDQVDLVEGATNTNPPVTLAFTAYAHLEGGNGNDVLKGGDAADDLWGGVTTDAASAANGNDTLSGGKGTDTLRGGGGSDTLNGDLGVDTLYAGEGNDRANGGAAGDRVEGGEGNDVLDGGPGVQPKTGDGPAETAAYDGGDTLVGGPGTDALVGGRGVDRIYGDDEAAVCGSTALGGENKDTVDAGEGDDFVYGGADDDQLTGGPDSDVLCGSSGNDVLEGDTPATSSGGGDDSLTGGPGNDALFGRSGTDTIRGDDGNDRLTGDSGDDKLIGGRGRDAIDGSAGRDIALGDGGTIDPGAHPVGQAERLAMAHPEASSGTDTVDCASLPADPQGRITSTSSGTADCMAGGEDEDVLFGGGGGDRMQGDDGADHLDGGAGGDVMRGGRHGDAMLGRADGDEMYGDSGADVMQGDEGPDTMRGGLDGDAMQGGSEVDTMYGDAGQDDLVGGSDTAGSADAGDAIHGGADPDVIAGDNARLSRGGGADADDPTSQARTVELFDVGSTDAALSGVDTVHGGEANDRVFGQGSGDVLHGEEGRDRLFGNEADDTMHGGDGDDLMVGGSAASGTADAGDRMHGGRHADVMVGDNGTLTWAGALTPDDSNAAGSFGDDTMNGDDGDDVMYGELGGDTMHGNADHDRMVGDLGTVTPISGTPARDPDGVPRSTVALVAPQLGGVDRMHGDGSADRMWAGAAADVAEGGPGNDYVEGNDGADTLRGFNATVDDGLVQPTDASDQLVMALGDDDDIIGGSSTANPDALKRDVGEALIQGNGGQDVILGDNGTLTRTPTPDGSQWTADAVMGGPARTVALFDTDRPATELPSVSGGDTVEGNGGNDRAYGEAGDDVLDGNDGNDVLAGNQDVDTIHGNGGEDDVVGGSLGGPADAAIPAAGQLDAGDRLYGDSGADVLTGDNAEVVRPLDPGGLAWATDPITLGHAREVRLWDTERTAPTSVSGSDLVLGGDHRDRLHGQGGNDTVKGNADDDFGQGNQGSDLLEGNDGEDDLIGGSVVADRADGDDVLHGGGQADVAIGDNGVIDRTDREPDGGYYYTTYQIGPTSQRFVQLLDIESTDGDVSGSDQVSGGSAVDVLFGQSERDYLFGGAEDDYLEGNAGSDFQFGDLVRGDVTPTGAPPEMTGGLPALTDDLPLESAGDATPESSEPALSGAPGRPGQDDVIGGHSRSGLLDDGDFQYGNDAADFLLGDNGVLMRTIEGTTYTTYASYNPTTFVRAATRFCSTAQSTCEEQGRAGGDHQEGNAGDDYIWGQDGADTQYGGTENDDMHGELGDDQMFGEDGEDAMVGDRGSITDTKIAGSGSRVSADTKGPAFLSYTGLEDGQLDRRVDLTKDLGAAALPHPGLTTGGADRMRGGRGHDSMHGAFGEDLMNGDSGGDWLFGADGGDVMWGGKGSDNVLTPNARHESSGVNAAQGVTRDNLVDYLFGGHGGSATSAHAEFTGGSDILDWRPRPGVDPASWLEMTDTDDGDASDNQHHAGIDWIYGGFHRDVMQGDVGKNGPDHGDRLMDWTGNFNLYSRCNASYGDDGDIRQETPSLRAALEAIAYGSGAGPTRAAVSDPTSSGGRELGLVYPGDPENNGAPYATSPGHFDTPNCNAL